MTVDTAETLKRGARTIDFLLTGKLMTDAIRLCRDASLLKDFLIVIGPGSQSCIRGRIPWNVAFLDVSFGHQRKTRRRHSSTARQYMCICT